jgi:hypothetical protein
MSRMGRFVGFGEQAHETFLRSVPITGSNRK